MGLNEQDIKRILWTFVQAAAAVAVAAAVGWTNGDAFNWKVVLVGALAAGLSAIKNLVLPDTSTLK
jgi:hypothetical protein